MKLGAHLQVLKTLNTKVLNESTKYDKSRGEEVDRKHMQNRENLARGRIRSYDYKLKKGKKVKKSKCRKERILSFSFLFTYFVVYLREIMQLCWRI